MPEDRWESASPCVGWAAIDVAGEMPLGVLIDTIMTGEVMLHTWDLARAAGVDVELDPVMAEEMLTRWEPMDGPELRNPHVFGPRVTASEGASSADQLLAFSGRQV